MTSQNPKISTNIPPARGNIPSTRMPGPPGSSRPNMIPSAGPGKRPITQYNKFPPPAGSPSKEKPEKQYSDEEQQSVSNHGDEEEEHLRPETVEEPEIKSRKPRFESKHTDEEDDPHDPEGIENEGDTPRNLMSLSESLKTMKNLRSNFQSFQYEAEEHDYEDRQDDKLDKEYEDEDYVKVESGEEDNIHNTDKDLENEEHDDEEYYEKGRASGSFSKGHYIEKIHEELHEESHRDDDEEDVESRRQYTEEDKEEEILKEEREYTEEDVVAISSRQALEEPLLKNDNEDEEDQDLSEKEPEEIRTQSQELPKEEEQTHHLLPSEKKYEEVKHQEDKSQKIGHGKDKIQEERDRFFEELEQGGIQNNETKEEYEIKPVEASQKDETVRKSDSYEPPHREDVPSPQEKSSVNITNEPPQREEDPEQKIELPQMGSLPPPMGMIPPQRRNVPPQRAQIPPQRGNIPVNRGNMPPQRVGIPQQKVNIPSQKEIESPQRENLPMQPEIKSPQKEEKPIQQILEPPQKDVELTQQISEPPQRENESPQLEHEPPQKEEEEDLPPPKMSAPMPRKNVPPQREPAHQAPKFFMPSSHQENVSKQSLSFPQNLNSPLQPVAQRTASDVEYESMITASAKDSSENALLVRLKKVEIELKKEKKKNESLEAEREQILFENKDLKQQVIELKTRFGATNKKQGSDLFSQTEQETLDKLKLELKTTVEGSRLVTEHSNKIIAESAKYKQEMECLVNSLEEERKQLQKTVLELKAQVHEEQLKVETQQQKTDFFEKKAREYEESFDLVNRQLNERMEAFQKLASINQDVQVAIQSLPKIETFLAKIQPQTNSVAVQTISSQLNFSKNVSPHAESSSPIQQTGPSLSTKAPQTISTSPQVKEPVSFGLLKPTVQTSEKKTPQVKVTEASNEFTLSPQAKEQPKTNLSSKPEKSLQTEQRKSKDKDDEVNVSESSELWFETSNIFTSQTVNKSKDLLKVSAQPVFSKVQEEKEKGKSNTLQLPKEKVLPSSKTSLQADDFFKDIIIPDSKTSFAQESNLPSETKIKSPIKAESPFQKINTKEIEKTNLGKFAYNPEEENEKDIFEVQTPESSKPKLPQKEQAPKVEETKTSTIIPKEEPKPQKPALNLPQGKSLVPQFAKTGTADQAPKKIGPVILAKPVTSDQQKSTPTLNLGNVQTKSGTRYSQPKKGIDNNFISVESDNFFGELGLGDSASKLTDPFKGSLRESTSSLRTSKQGVDLFSQPVVKKKTLQ